MHSNKFGKRRRIFNLYSANLKNYLDAIGRNDLDPTNQAYICPLCYRPFPVSQLEDTGQDNYLTMEHNPPESMGGRDNILTCKECNNTCGAKLDVLARDLLVMESFLFSPNATIAAKFLINGNPIKGRVKKVGAGKGVIPNPKSNPKAYQLLKQSLEEGTPIKIEHTLTSPEWSDYSLAMLKIAYLQAFELFGYHFADLGNAVPLREVLQGKAAYPVPNNGVIDIFAEDAMAGINIVIEPAELKALILTIPLRFTHDQNIVRKNVPIVLPAPFQGGYELLENHKSRLNTNVNIRMVKYSIPSPPLPNNRDYHLMFYQK